jgi:RNA-directed DNA polymerase
MKRHGHLWEQVVSFEALLRAADTARKGKRFRPAVAAFHFHLEHEL